MNSRLRLIAALTGQAADRVPLNFYEVGGLPAAPDDPDPWNIYNDPSWRPLLDLAESETDLVRMTRPALHARSESCRAAFFHESVEEDHHSRYRIIEVRVAGRVLREVRRRDKDIDTQWHTERLLKSPDDVRAFLSLPDDVFSYRPDITPIERLEKCLGDRGLVMIDTEDPLCAAAELFSMEDYLTMAYTEQSLFHQLLEKFTRSIYPRTVQTAAAAPGRLWRIYGPEYATEPYLPPALFEEYVCRYTAPLVRTIQKHGGWARLHCHGRIRQALPAIVAMGVNALDPVEPPPQGDVSLADARRLTGGAVTLFGNIEVSALETLGPTAFKSLAMKTIEMGMADGGRRFVLMPTAAPYGRRITARTMGNYEILVRLAQNT